MRMWMIDPSLLCNTHLIAEHYECHCIAGGLIKGRSYKGLINANLVELKKLKSRHDELVVEMISRFILHESPLVFKYKKEYGIGSVDVEESKRVLGGRCPNCRKRIEGK